MKRFIALALCAALSAQAELVEIAASADGQATYDIETTSFSVSETLNGTPIYRAYGQVTIRSKVDIQQWYVYVGACAMNYRKLYTNDSSGNPLFSNDVIRGGKSIASTIADTLCTVTASSKGTAL